MVMKIMCSFQMADVPLHTIDDDDDNAFLLMALHGDRQRLMARK